MGGLFSFPLFPLKLRIIAQYIYVDYRKKLAAVPFGPVIQKQRARLWCPNLGREAENWSTIVFVASPLSGCFRIEGSVREAGSVSSSA